ncbi:MAG: pilus (MSHA type) biogenesis protein MshL [Granulosicoccus sp.]|nr:pilus (MSHA type) biogenesis protein MshL [Granulosicoccus sp.]
MKHRPANLQNRRSFRQQIMHGFLGILLTGCTAAPVISPENMESIIQALEDSTAAKADNQVLVPPAVVAAALLPKISNEPDDTEPDFEPRFDISVKAAEAPRFFMSLVKGTDMNMVVHPDVSGQISLSLRDVTLTEILSTVRDIHGYSFRRQGNTYQVFPANMRTQVFSINYLDIVRNGNSRTSVSSGETSRSDSDSQSQVSGTTTPGGSNSGSGVSGSEVRTGSQSNFWKDLQDSLTLIVGSDDGRKVIVHSQSGVIVVHAMPEELLDVQDYLNTIEDVSHRLVVLEAKVIEVTLNDNFQAGINWNSLIELGGSKSIQLGRTGGEVNPAASALGGIFAINANLNDFSGMLELFKTQGDVQVLSSPRISTVNNQKAVIKVGQDEYFVTDFDTETELANGVGNQNVDVSLTPFFSGVALDVLPQIDANDNVILHIHPAISEVREMGKNIKISTNTDLTIPLALSTIRESDSVVRAKSGQVIVVGGLMKNATRFEESRTPGLGDIPFIGELFRNRREVATKSELVILLRPIVIHSDEQWKTQLQNNTERFGDIRTPENTSALKPSHTE